MANKIIITDEIMDDVWSGKGVNDALREKYYGEIQDKINSNAFFKNMSPMQMALYDAGVTKNTRIGDVMNMGTISTQEAGEWLLPAYIDTRLREVIEKNDILKYLVKSTVNAPTMVTQSAYLDMTDPENAKNAKKSRVAEGADLPLAKLKIGETAISLHKYGRAVQQTYEAAKLMTVDMFTKTLDMIANDVTNQEVEEAARVALEGDGNNNPADVLITTKAKDIVTAEELADALLDYWYKTGMAATTIVCGKEMYKNMYKMVYDVNQIFGVNSKFAMNTPQLPGATLNLICTKSDLKSGANNVALVLNNEMSLTKHVLNGSMIREYNKNIRNQTNLGTISEITGFSKNLPDGVMMIKSQA